VTISARERAVAEVTTLLQRWNVDVEARSDALELLYDDLKRRAAWWLRRERATTLSTTALVHESYLRLQNQTRLWQSREQFLAIAARMMRRILVDRARARDAAKRAVLLVELSDVDAIEQPPSVSVVAVDEALDDLSKEDERAAQLVELRYFGGMTQNEAASALLVSPATAARDWAFARAWLFRRLRATGDPARG
jgi:RNA polymerase sigma factor (TIGR02999 family)